MTGPLLQRRKTWLERAWIWLLFGSAAAGVSGAAALFIYSGGLSDFEIFPAVARGYTPLGLTYGVLATVCLAVTFFYSFRRRPLQEALPLGKGSMAAWLWVHVVFGTLALWFALLHAGAGNLALRASSGKALLILLALIALGGALWRLLYLLLPKRATREVGNYATEESRARSDAIAIELEKLAAGRSPTLQRLTSQLFEAPLTLSEVASLGATLPPQERAVFTEIARLTAERHASLGREAKQRRYVARLQGMRLYHVPISLLLAIGLPLHVVLAFDLPERLLANTRAAPLVASFEPAQTCAQCHARVVEEWRSSMHAHALSGPIMIAQTNLAARTTLQAGPTPDPKQICVNCHGPLAARLSPSDKLPVPALQTTTLTPWLDAQNSLLTDGVNCIACHAADGEPHTGGAALTAFQSTLAAGRTYGGALDQPVGNAFHRSVDSSHASAPERLCQSCHSVVYDRNGDGKIEKGPDLVLQDLFSEWQAYRASGGAHCVDCHMPLLGKGRAAESARIPIEQDDEAPPRPLRSHRFIGPDYPLDEPALRDAHRPARTALLQQAAKLSVVAGSVSFVDGRAQVRLAVANTGVGHNLPGGFAFVRQMWIELQVLDSAGRVAAQTGTLRRSSDDLCDAELLRDANPLRGFAVGCLKPDESLVNFQQLLLDRIEFTRDGGGRAVVTRPPGAVEVVVQHLTSGSVPRVRPFDRRPTPPLSPGESRTFDFSLELPSGTTPAQLRARLLFRAVPPYFLRALEAQQQPEDGPPLSRWIDQIEIVEMASVTAAFNR
ncbi:MAG TPA: multiheme c-type cytochrome [Polyangiaceae bacterium]|nr:multiheme c-type cytochrome [Polyangiaceae bacterium]